MRKLMIVAAALLLAACSGSSTPAPSAAPSAAASAAASGAAASAGAPALSGTLKILIHQNPPLVDFMTAFNKTFEAANPGLTVDMSVVNANDLPTNVNTRLTAKDVDIVVPTTTGLSSPVQSYMKNVTPPYWQSLIDGGNLLDLTDQAFVKNYDPTAIKDASTYNGKVYTINLGRVAYGGLYYNKDLFTKNNVKVPTTWSELVTACATFKAANIPCMTAGGKDGWPVFVGAFGLGGAAYPDQAALVQGLWDGSIKYTDAKYVDLLKKYQIYNGDMMEPGASGLAGDAAPGRFASGAVAMEAGGSWYAAAIDAAKPAFQWGYIPFPGSDNAADNQNMFGKYDMSFAVSADAPNKAAALAYLAAFSDPANYQAFVTAVGFIPTQPGATLDTQIGKELAPYLANFKVGFEEYWVPPKGAGANAGCALGVNLFKPYGTFDDPATAAAACQSDLGF